MGDSSRLELVRPAREYLAGYVAALERGWSRDNIRGLEATREDLADIARDADAFLARQWDPEAKGPPIKLPDGTQARRLPGVLFWVWDSEFCGAINFRWQPGTSDLPPHVLGHIGYAIVPWKQRRGYATAALRRILDHARAEGLEHVLITADADNIASQKVILAAGGALLERFNKPAVYGGKPSLKFRIDLKHGSKP